MIRFYDQEDILKFLRITEKYKVSSFEYKWKPLGVLLKFGRTKLWYNNEVNFLKENYFNMPIEKLSSMLNRNEMAVKAKVKRLGLGVITT